MSRLRPWLSRARRRVSPRRSVLRIGELDSRVVPAVTATFTAEGGTLSVFGDALNNTITVSRNAVGTIFINGGAVAVVGGTPTVANVALIQVFGGDGNDIVTFNQASGALPASFQFGGAGNDTLTGGSGSDQLLGEAGNDTLSGKGGFDLLFGGDDNDVLTGGNDDDQVFGQSGNDRMVWNDGDDTDLNEGGAGTDTTEVNGGIAAEQFVVTANGTRVRFDRATPAPFAIDIGETENLVLNANGGNDQFSTTGDLASLIHITVDGGAGNDTLLGSNGIDSLLGGIGNDFIDGQQGNDLAQMGAGNDVFQWDPGDGSDTIEGQAGVDKMLFNGSNGAEIFEASANGGRLRFTRNLGGIVMDTNDVETVAVNAQGGTDTVTVNNLFGTDVTRVELNLAATGGTEGDTLPDIVTVNGTNANNVVTVSGTGDTATVKGLKAVVFLDGVEAANDQLVISALGGNDTVNAAALPAGVVRYTADGGAGNDTLTGGLGSEVFRGGDGNDTVDGNPGFDVIFLGAGDDTAVWNPGDGNDTIEGQDGADVLRFNGSLAAETINLFANGERLTLLQDVGGITMDVDVERVDVNALGGADIVGVGDLTGTAVTAVNVNVGGKDLKADTVVVSGTNGDDAVRIVGSAAVGTRVLGLSAVVTVTGAEAVRDVLTLNALDGEDAVNASGLAAGVIGLTQIGGLGEDVLIGSNGKDLFFGGDGNDTALMGAGDDTFVWNPGDDNDTLEGQAGTDTMLFNGAALNENIDIAADGGRVRFFRNIANVVMDLNDTETIAFNALGGADNIVVNDLSGTDVTRIDLNLRAAPGIPGGDNAVDSVTVFGTNDRDAVQVSGGASGIAVAGLAARVNILGSEGANDRLTFNALAGDDVMTAASLVAGFIQLVADGGDGDDTLTGSAGNDVLTGAAGDDLLIGGAGQDVLNAAPGNDIVIQ